MFIKALPRLTIINDQIMQKKLTHPLVLAALSGILSFIAICHINLLIGCISFVPLFISMHNRPLGQAVKCAVIYAVCFAIPAFIWMIPAAERFTGSDASYGIFLFVVSIIFYMLYSCLFLLVFVKIRNKFSNSANTFINSLLAASVFCLAEALLNAATTGLPWFNIHSGNAMLRNNYSIQPASYFGIHILSFIIVFINHLSAMIWVQKNKLNLFIPAAILLIYIIVGVVILNQFEKFSKDQPSFKVAIICENIPPETKWDNETGNALAKRFLDLNHEAVIQKPEIILWSESAIPWTYKKDDDLIKAILQITDPAAINHIIGINSEGGNNEIYNSVYSLSPGGKVQGRFDKQYLLTFMEKPVSGIAVPFVSGGNLTARTDKTYSSPLTTIKGKAGILICNEAAISAAAVAQVNRGASFMMNLSNDGWFSESYLKTIHFYYARLRAVETRKDMAINSNNGFSGMVKASGIIADKLSSDKPFVQMVDITPNDILPIACSQPFLFLYLCLAFPVMLIICFYLKKTGVLNKSSSHLDRKN